MKSAHVYRIPTAGPDDVHGLQALFDRGELAPDEIVAILGKTEGNGCVNDFTRGYSTHALKVMLAQAMNLTRDAVAQRIAFVMSGGTEGIISPHLTVFARRGAVNVASASHRRLAIGIAHSRAFHAEDIGRMAQVQGVAEAVTAAVKDAGIADSKDVHFVQIKCPLLTSERIDDAARRGKTVATHDTYESMGYSRGASAIGVALALGEIDAADLSDEKICADWSLYSRVASTSAGIELMNCEIIVMGNSAGSASPFIVGHDVMRDAIDSQAVYRALRSVGIDGEADAKRIVNVFAKAEADPSGHVRGARHTMLNDSDVNHSRMARAVVGGVIASITGDPVVYVSGGAEHQGPSGGGPIAVIARA